jgi:hypothetical protein
MNVAEVSGEDAEMEHPVVSEPRERRRRGQSKACRDADGDQLFLESQ